MQRTSLIFLILVFFISSLANAGPTSEEEAKLDERERQIRHELHQLQLRRKRQYKNDQQCCRQCALRGDDVNDEPCCQRLATRECPYRAATDCGIPEAPPMKVPGPRPTRIVYRDGYKTVTRKVDTNHPVCPPYERFTECGTDCELTCSTYGLDLKCDSQRCVETNVCECEIGRVRNTYGQCVLPSDCPKRHISYPQYRDEETTEYDQVPKTVIKREYRQINKTVPVCPPYEHFEDCGTACEPNCDVYDSKRINCPHNCIDRVCICDEGYVRDHHGKCIYPNSCPPRHISYPTYDVRYESEPYDVPETVMETVPRKVYKRVPVCPHNEEFKECGTACEPTCGSYTNNVECNSQQHPCIDNVCQCIHGYVRNEQGVCVYPSECSRRSPSYPKYETRSKIIEEQEPAPMEMVEYLPEEPQPAPVYEKVQKTCCDRCSSQGCAETGCDRCRCNHAFVNCPYANQVRG